MLNEYKQAFIITLILHFLGQECYNALSIIAPCLKGQFQCQSDNLCISVKLICDGKTDCLDQSDEWNCTTFICSESEFRCAMTGHCIQNSLVCDGASDCIDLSDEEGCSGSRNASLAVEAYPCKRNQFHCVKDSKCIPFFRFCNSFDDCTDGSDERDCNQRKIVSRTTLSYPCKFGEFFCGEDLKCIPMLMWCDYYEDCSDGSDELYCDQLNSATIGSDLIRTNYVCNHNQFSCKQDGKCISQRLRCDHTEDCRDGSDEKCCDQVCGRIKTSSAISKIVGGKPAAQKDWPWMAALIYTDMIKPFCGGTLISNIHVLTAAHCLLYRKKVKVCLGEYNFANDSDNNPQDFEIEEIRTHELPGKTTVNPVQTTPKTPSQTAPQKKNRPFDCSEVCSPSENCESGVYTIYPVANQALEVWCDLHTSGGKWTVLVSRKKLPLQVNFIRNWNEYKNGFGTAGTEYWIGNDIMHHLTNAKNYTLRIDAISSDLGHTWGEFKTFKVGSEALKYVLLLEDPTTDGSIVYNKENGLKLHNGLKFTTSDSDNDESPRGNCGQLYGAGMWYARCYNFLPTGQYGVHKNEGIKFESWSKDNPTIGYANYLQFKIRLT